MYAKKCVTSANLNRISSGFGLGYEAYAGKDTVAAMLQSLCTRVDCPSPKRGGGGGGVVRGASFLRVAAAVDGRNA